MRQAVVLGGGMVGSVIAADMAADPGYQVTVVDVSESSLAAVAERTAGRVRTVQADLSSAAEITRVIESADIVLGALASHLGYGALRAVIEAGKNLCDISFMPENALEFDALAKERGVIAVVDCGVAPGLSHMMSGYGAAELAPAESIEIYVGGLPRERCWPFEYKAGFAPSDVIEEYTRPARLVENGQEVIREALSEPELMAFAGVGTLEAFNTDGLRSLVQTLDVPEMKEKTLRYPGHIELMRVFRHAGLFSKEPVEVNGVSVAPLDLFSALVFPKWQFQPGEEDLTVMRVVVRGQRDGAAAELSWDLLDLYDRASSATSMSRTTGFPCAILARLIADGGLAESGVFAPEQIATQKGVFEHVLRELNARGVKVTQG